MLIIFLTFYQKLIYYFNFMKSLTVKEARLLTKKIVDEEISEKSYSTKEFYYTKKQLFSLVYYSIILASSKTIEK